jgi:hypothetical protein
MHARVLLAVGWCAAAYFGASCADSQSPAPPPRFHQPSQIVGKGDGLPGGNLEITPAMLKFKYRFNEGETLYCTHELMDPFSQDWDVVCRAEDSSYTRRYRVHLWVTEYGHDTGPIKLSIEILYWVTDLTHQPIEGGGTSWIHLADVTPIGGLELTQYLESSGGLNLVIDPTLR